MRYEPYMRGMENRQEEVFSYVPMEKRIPADHPIRKIRALTDECLARLSSAFDELYAERGRPSIPPEYLLRALLLQVLYTVRSETQLMECLRYHLLYRWFVGLGMDEEVWDVTVFTKNRDRLLEGEVAHKFFQQVLQRAEAGKVLSEEHFTVDGTMIEAWANRKSFQEKKDPPEKGSGVRGRKLFRDTHESKSDGEAHLMSKSRSAEIKPCYMGHVITENRNGLIVQACATQASKTAEREAGLEMMKRRLGSKKKKPGQEFTLGADKGYQEEKFVKGVRALGVIPHVAEYAENKNWPNWLESSERQHPGYAVSLSKRKLVEKVFGWIKSIGGLSKTKLRGARKVNWLFQFAAATYNLLRLAKLLPATV
jgi:transposase